MPSPSALRNPPSEVLQRPVQFIKGVGPRRAKTLERLGLRTVDDLLHHLPARYYDRRLMTPRSPVSGVISRRS